MAVDASPAGWVFPSKRISKPLSKDNWWRREMLPRLKPLSLEWATLQVMRRSCANHMNKNGTPPRVIAGQLGHGVGVDLNHYNQVDRSQKEEAVRKLATQILQ